MTNTVLATGLGVRIGGRQPIGGLLKGISYPGGLTKGMAWWIVTVGLFLPGSKDMAGAQTFLTVGGAGGDKGFLLQLSCCFFAIDSLILSMMAYLSGFGRDGGASFLIGLGIGVDVGVSLSGIFIT